MPHRKPLLAALLATLLSPLTAWGLTIDDFAGTTQSETDCDIGGSAFSEEAHSVLGGARMIISASRSNAGCITVSAGGGTGTISTDSGGSGDGFFQYDGIADGAGNSASLNADLTQGGTLDRFRIEVLSVTNFAGTLTVLLHDVDSSAAGNVLVSGSGNFDILFSAYFGIDFTDVRDIRVAPTRLSSESSIVLGSFSVVPEPSAGFLFGAGLITLAASRRRTAA